ncbi:HAD-IIIA family hydrolase, partial [Escherichia sp. HC-CC]
IFLDRDGTINVDHGYVHEIDNFEFIDGVIDAMRELKKMGFALVVVTNQSGIARGKFKVVDLMDIAVIDINGAITVKKNCGYA